MTSQKADKFRSLAEARVNKTIKDIKLIGNLANRSTYEYSESEVSQMFKALQTELDNAKRRFKQNGKGNSEEFRFN